MKYLNNYETIRLRYNCITCIYSRLAASVRNYHMTKGTKFLMVKGKWHIKPSRIKDYI